MPNARTKHQNEATRNGLEINDPTSNPIQTLKLALMKILEETDLLFHPITSATTKGRLRAAIQADMNDLKSALGEKYPSILSGPDGVELLCQSASQYRQDEGLRWQYYTQSASHLLHDEQMVLTLPTGNVKGPVFLSKFLRRGFSVYEDGTVDERLLDYKKFLAWANVDANAYAFGLWHQEAGGDVEVNAFDDQHTWTSAMIEDQKALRDGYGYFDFRVYTK